MTSTTMQWPQWLSLHGLFVVLGLLVYVLTTHTLRQRREPTAAISWVLIIALAPYVGLPLYLLFGMRKVGYAHASSIDRGSPNLHLDEMWSRQLASAMGQPPVAPYWNLRIHDDGKEALRCLWDLIENAESELVVSTFILGRDPMGDALMTRLMDKSRAGVKVFLLIDGIGRRMGGGANLRKLKATGVQIALFGPLLHVPFKTSTNLRNHRKMLVADRQRLWCGGRNFAEEYFEGRQKRAPWRDLTFDLEGPLVAQARALFERDWQVANGMPRTERQKQHDAKVAEEPFAQLIASGPDQADDTVHDLLLTACYKARTRIIAATPYFVPSEALLMALSLAARRGATVDLVLPSRSNHRMADFARHRALRTLATAGGRIWLTPYMQHGKAVVVDDCLALAGSVNLDSRSLFLNYELMIAFYAIADVGRFATFIEKHRGAAVRYHARTPGLIRDLAEGLLLWLAFQL